MAELEIEGDELVLRLSTLESVEGVHGSLRVPLAAVSGVEILENAHDPADRGLKIGARIFGVLEVGTFLSSRKAFAAVHHDTPRGVRVVLSKGTDGSGATGGPGAPGGSYDEWIVGCADPEAVVVRLRLPRG
jgi:hypothetical protein